MKKMWHKDIGRIALKAIIVFAFCTMFLIHVEKSHASETRGINVAVKDDSGQELLLYKASYALIIGVSDYTDGWPDLKSIPEELDATEETLRKQGFRITRVMNPDSETLNASFENFIDQYGFDPNNRLLFFFSGHGHTRKGGEKGYLVPTDAPNPRRDKLGFLRKALAMDQILSWSRQMEAKHAIFLFDSCFSGTVFKVKALPKRPPHITRSTSLPVRQYIAAGDAGDPVPASSVFTPVFIDALKYGWADLNGDSYISGTELGIYLQEKVPQHTSQTPQYGKIKDYKLSRGDYVFVIKSELGDCTLRVDSSPSGAKILVNGRLEGTAPLEIAGLTPGRLLVEAKKEGYETYKEQVLIREDHSLELKAVLKKSHSRGGGIILVRSDVKQARWYLDGIYVGRTPDEMKNVSPGSHRITVKEKGFPDWSQLINVIEGERVGVHARLGAEKPKRNARQSQIYVDTNPANAKVKIMNIRPKYKRGMSLLPGSYHLNVSAPGYITQDRWVQLTTREEGYFQINLLPIQKASATSKMQGNPMSGFVEPGSLPLEPSSQSALSPGLTLRVNPQQVETSHDKPISAEQVLENVKRAVIFWKDSILAGPTGPTEENKGDLDIGDPSRRGMR